jgi:hypothetical protein
MTFQLLSELDELNAALEKDGVTGSELLRKLDDIYVALTKFASNYPTTWQYLCQSALSTGEMTLGDALSGIEWGVNTIDGEGE